MRLNRGTYQQMPIRARKIIEVAGLCLCVMLFDMTAFTIHPGRCVHRIHDAALCEEEGVQRYAYAESQASSRERVASAGDSTSGMHSYDFHPYGIVCQDENRCSALEASLVKAIELNPRNRDAHIALGIVRLYQGKFPSVEEQSMIAGRPKNKKGGPHVQSGYGYLNEEKFSESEAFLTTAMQDVPDACEFYIALGRYFELQGKCASAADMFKKALALIHPYRLCGDRLFYMWDGLIRSKIGTRKIR